MTARSICAGVRLLASLGLLPTSLWLSAVNIAVYPSAGEATGCVRRMRVLGDVKISAKSRRYTYGSRTPRLGSWRSRSMTVRYVFWKKMGDPCCRRRPGDGVVYSKVISKSVYVPCCIEICPRLLRPIFDAACV